LSSVVVAGPGALGLLFASRLADAGVRTCLLDYRDDRAARLTRDGITLRFEGIERRLRVTATADGRADAVRGADVALICVKAHATESAARSLQWFPGPVATIQNGLDNVETLAEAFGDERVLPGSTSEAATLVATGSVHHTGRGTTIIGSMTSDAMSSAQALCDTLSLAGFDARVTHDWRSAVWSKALVNAAINPLTALLGVRNGVIADDIDAAAVARRISAECEAIAHASGIDSISDSENRVIDVCQATALNRSSMLQDLEAGRKTEIDSINGVLLREAERLLCDAVTLQTVTSLMRAKERAVLAQ